MVDDFIARCKEVAEAEKEAEYSWVVKMAVRIMVKAMIGASAMLTYIWLLSMLSKRVV